MHEFPAGTSPGTRAAARVFPVHSAPMPTPSPRRFDPLAFIERVGNALPDPAILFVCGCVLVMVLSHVGFRLGWSVQPVQIREVMRDVTDASGKPVLDDKGQPTREPIRDERTGRPKTELVKSGDPIQPKSLLTSDGIYWCLSTMVTNFTTFPPLGIVLVAMFGVGVAERTGLFDSLIKWLAMLVPSKLLTPTAVFLGFVSHMAADSGYVVLPPLIAVLFFAAGRSPLAGIAAVFAGIGGGFSANLMVSGTDALVSGITDANVKILDPNYRVQPTCNWYFMAASVPLLTLIGWFVSSKIVEPRFATRPEDEGGPPVQLGGVKNELSPAERKALGWSALALLVTLGVVLAMVFVPGWPLHGEATDPVTKRSEHRWVATIIPLVLFLFLIPGIAYGLSIGKFRTQKDLVNAFVDSMRSMAPVIAMAFFAAQFIKYFAESNLGRMLAITGGEALAMADLPPTLIIVLFIVLTMIINLLISSMSAKFLIMAPIFVPMFMMLGLSPELTQAAYRVGDSVTNTITPMNAYLVILLAVMNKYAKSAGMGTLISMMVPYSIAFAITWGALLLLWMQMGWPLGPGAGLWYIPAK